MGWEERGSMKTRRRSSQGEDDEASTSVGVPLDPTAWPWALAMPRRTHEASTGVWADGRGYDQRMAKGGRDIIRHNWRATLAMQSRLRAGQMHANSVTQDSPRSCPLEEAHA
ncbi:hypothetical protein JDV02_000752 [Purpureocillium takamizusanense]|uniref:Uncharacterized protein n=1 Tax=Purpureocillium takamizusanense TaxID=2060973 RepID=A0A9Q8Q5G3_9HYPO|nr:uncharacterized protein JDV02_000752 [Purpureocillium takamizusanense]UNI14079.1 hypothetical protein JDV02_000752 [Purpureocillium takamizusanense]